MKQAKTIREAIKRLPEIDRRWDYDAPSKTAYDMKTALCLSGYNNENNISELHSAALTFGYEIGWEPDGDGKYVAKFFDGQEDTVLDGKAKTIDKAIEAAFVAAVNDKLKEMGK